MKIAVVSDDGRTISPHFGRASLYIIYEADGGEIRERKVVPKFSPHATGEGHGGPEGHEEHKHSAMLSSVEGCESLLAGGMGSGAYMAMKRMGIEPYITDEVDADEAVKKYLRGKLENHKERLH
jgi:predicted Fe-Mo cluster-binding NifX family protein